MKNIAQISASFLIAPVCDGGAPSAFATNNKSRLCEFLKDGYFNRKRTGIRFKGWSLSLLLFSLWFLISPRATGVGIAAIKEQKFHEDAGASVIVYDKLLEDNTPSIKITTKGQKVFTIERSKLAGKVELLSAIPANINNDSEIKTLRDTLKSAQDFSKRFPKSGPVLANQVSALEGHIKQFEGGKVRHNGEWMNKEKLTAILQEKQRENRAIEEKFEQEQRERLKQERLKREAEQLAKAEQLANKKKIQEEATKNEKKSKGHVLGETKEECIAKFGQPIRERLPTKWDIEQNNFTEVSSTFNADPFTVEVHFFQGKCSTAYFSKGGFNFSDDEIAILLRANGGNQTWVRDPRFNSSVIFWDTDNKKVSSQYNRRSPCYLSIHLEHENAMEHAPINAAYKAQQDAAKAAEAKKLEDF